MSPVLMQPNHPLRTAAVKSFKVNGDAEIDEKVIDNPVKV